MEHRDDGLLVDYSGQELRDSGQRGEHGRRVMYDEKQEREIGPLDQETRLFRAMNEIRAYSPKGMTPQQRELFNTMCEGIFRKHGITPETYAAQFGHLGTAQNLRR